MNYERTFRAVAAVVLGYVVVLIVWLGWIRMPPETLPYQLAALFIGFGAAIGVAWLWANRGTAEQRRLTRNGVEGWATVEAIHTLDTKRSELYLHFTVPGSHAFTGKIVHSIPPEERRRFERGSVVPIMVDPKDHHRVLLLPSKSLDE